MKILWIVNTVFPAPSEAVGLSIPVFGGWMYGLAKQLSEVEGIELAVATTYNGSEFKKMTLENIDYFLLPNNDQSKYDNKLEEFWIQVYEQFKSDLVHIHGTEYAHGLACMRKLPDLKYVISIQGLISICSRYYHTGVSSWDIVKNITFRDIVRMDTIFQQKWKFEKRGKYEIEYINRTKHIIGRTNWDRTHSESINPTVNYHFCNESLRDGFYSAEKWSFKNCDQYTIFFSQAGYPIKGLSLALKALAIVKKSFPNVKIKVGGSDIRKNLTVGSRIKLSGYSKYLSKLLKELDLDNNVFFLGLLSEEKMIAEYQKANVFVCASTIENSSNSLGEAQLIGTPSVASYVGGIPDMVEHEKTGLLYRFEEYEMLAVNIKRLFEDVELAKKLSLQSVKIASLRHDKAVNLNVLLSIYSSL